MLFDSEVAGVDSYERAIPDACCEVQSWEMWQFEWQVAAQSFIDHIPLPLPHHPHYLTSVIFEILFFHKTTLWDFMSEQIRNFHYSVYIVIYLFFKSNVN